MHRLTQATIRENQARVKFTRNGWIYTPSKEYLAHAAKYKRKDDKRKEEVWRFE